MFGKKKEQLPAGTRLMHYEGLPGFMQDSPCFMEQTAEALLFHRVGGSTITLPLEKVTGVDIMEERHFAAKYRGTGLNTSKTSAVKWYAVISYTPDKSVVVWFLGGKESAVMWAHKKQIEEHAPSITL